MTSKSYVCNSAKLFCMEEALSSVSSGEELEVESITAAMLSSNSLEEVLKIFLVNLGESSPLIESPSITLLVLKRGRF